MKHRIHSIIILAIILLSGAAFSQETLDAREGAIQINGRLEIVEDTPVLYTWGTPWEQGFAHGYLLKDRIVNLIEEFLTNGKMMNPQQYKHVITNLRFMKIQSHFEAELRGMLEGLIAKEGGPVRIEALKSVIKYNDLVMTNAMADLSRYRFACSSFVAWGNMTQNGDAFVGRNYEWPENSALINSQVIFVRLTSKDTNAMGTVSAFFPGQVGLITGMNEQGVTVATHDSSGNRPSYSWGYTPICLLYRHALENANASTAKEDISNVLKSLHTVTGNNMMVGRPFDGKNPAGIVLEHDADLTKDQGVTIREAEVDNSFIVSTNRYYKRESYRKLRPCSRYKKLRKALVLIDLDKGEKPMNLDMAWDTIEAAPLRIATYHRVIFEPNKKKMHITFPESKDPNKRITLDVALLLAKARKMSEE